MASIARARFALNQLQKLKPSYFRFLDLPKEIRCMIYQYCLTPSEHDVIFGEWYPHDGCCCHIEPKAGERKPQDDLAVDILAVSQFIREEAKPFRSLLFKTNQWALNSRSQIDKDRDKVIYSLPMPTVGEKFTNIRHLQMTFCRNDLPASTVVFFLCEFGGHGYHEYFHHKIRDFLILVWAEKINVVSQLKHLQTFEVDLSIAQDHAGCCDLQKHMLLDPIALGRFVDQALLDNLPPSDELSTIEVEEYESIRENVRIATNGQGFQLRVCGYSATMEMAHRAGMTCAQCPRTARFSYCEKAEEWHQKYEKGGPKES